MYNLRCLKMNMNNCKKLGLILTLNIFSKSPECFLKMDKKNVQN